jgi:hypothetical protein
MVEVKDCPDCKQKLITKFSKNYLSQNGNCWNCDLQKFKENLLFKTELIKRQILANIEDKLC